MHVFGWGFNQPDAIVSDGTHVWVANYAGDSVTELDASNGGRIRTIAGPRYAFASPVSIASSTGHVWVANRGGNSITELSAFTGALVRVISGIHGPAAITTNGTDVWVAAHYRCGHAGCVDHSQVTELSASTGHVVRLLSGPSYGFADPDAISADGTHVWVANSSANSVTEVRASTGTLTRTLSDSSYRFNEPDAIAVDGAHVWVASPDQLAEINAATGRLVKVINLTGNLVFPPGPVTDSVASDGVHVWVVHRFGPNGALGGDSGVTELTASTGKVVRDGLSPSYAFESADAVASDGVHVWVGNELGVGDGRCRTCGQATEVAEVSATTGAFVRAISGASYRFAEPRAIALGDSRVWVANGTGNSVTELSSTTGRLERVISGGYGFVGPGAVATGGAHVWVASGNNCITELNATSGALVRMISVPTPGCNSYCPSLRGCVEAIAVDGTHVWAGLYPSKPPYSRAVAEISASTGQVVKVISGARYKFASLRAIATDGTHVWIANDDGNSVTELNAQTGSLIRVISDPSDRFNHPAAIALSSGHVWVVSNGDGSSSGGVTELDASTGKLVSVISPPSLRGGADAIASDPAHIWVANIQGSVTELSARTGKVIAVLSGSEYQFNGPSAIATDGRRVWVANGRGQSVTEFPA